jgi:hypothetical protein
VGELCTVNRNGIPWPMIYGVGVDVKTGHIFPATFTDKGPDIDIRNARTLTGGENVGVRNQKSEPEKCGWKNSLTMQSFNFC